MKILITGPGTFVEKSKDAPVVGTYYNLDDADWGTNAQNRAFHALLNAFWHWMHRKDCFRVAVDPAHPENGYYNFATRDPEQFKEKFKIAYCGALKHYRFMGMDYRWHKVMEIKEIPLDVLNDYTGGNWDRIEAITKSWKDFTKTQRKDAIDTLGRLIWAFQCDDPKVQEIFQGMHDNEEKRRQEEFAEKARRA